MALTEGQKACVDTLGKPLAVSAGAGSGKTFTLTKRIVHALECGYLNDIDEVLSITFTTKAAGEIKSRVKSALRAAGMTAQALKVDDAWISTIHGMCSRILRAHALELGIDPQFGIIGDSGSKALLESALEEVIGERDDMVNGLSDIDQDRIDALFFELPARGRGGTYVVSVESVVRQLVTIAQASPDGMAAVQLPPAPAGPEKLLVQLVDAAREVCGLASAVKPGSARDKLLASTEAAIASVEAALGGGGEISYPETVKLMNAFPVPGANFGKGSVYREMQPELVMRYQSIASQACAGVIQPHLETIVSIASLVSDAFSRRKREAGVLDNSDLLTFAARALRDHPEIAACYVDRFKLVMIDEFQDTDQLQVDMISKLAGAAGERLCVVGDAQQSIYRFRGADVSVYRDHLASVRAVNPDGVIELTDNFRSHDDILRLCDRIFGGAHGGNQASSGGGDYMSLRAGRDESRVKRPFTEPGPRVNIQVTTLTSGASADAGARVQAARIADQFAAYRRAGHEPAEMVLLLGAMSKADVYAAAMRAVGLPCVVAGGSIFNRAPEVALVVRLAEALANPKNSKALFEVVSSEMFALSTDDLIELSTGVDPNRNIPKRRRFNEGFRSLERAAASGKATSAALMSVAALMNRASEQLGRVALSEIMQGIVVDSGWLARLEAAGPEGVARAGNVYKAIRYASQLETSSGLGPASVAARLAEDVEVAREAPGALSAGEGSSVRIMTVHASKGLEFPIVAIAEFGDDSLRSSALERCTISGRTYVSIDGGKTLSGLREKSSSLAAKSKGYSPFDEDYEPDDLARTIKVAKSPSDFRAAIHAFELAGEAAETRRLLYVAVTRAKEAVVISMRGRVRQDDSTGLSKSVWGDVQKGLVGNGGIFPDGVSNYDFGGSEQARVVRISLDVKGVAAFDERGLSAFDAIAGGEGVADAADDESADAAAEAQPAFFDVPVVPPYLPQRDRPWHSGREGLFSYSSISEDHGALADTSSAHWADEAVSGGSFETAMPAAAFDENVRPAADADAATTFGQAFHRLAQAAVLAWSPGCALAAPASRRHAIARGVGLRDTSSLERLDTALDRWFASSLAARVASFASLRAEVPFMCDMSAVNDGGDEGDGEAFLEGEIDLLACDDAPGTPSSPAGFALIVDYKTGGSSSESTRQLHEKHLLQATCYAYAVLSQGFEQVECDFVRVEQVAAESSSTTAASDLSASATEQPQVVSYEFAACDLPEIERAIWDARLACHASAAAKGRGPSAAAAAFDAANETTSGTTRETVNAPATAALDTTSNPIANATEDHS